MWVISPKRLREFWTEYPQAEMPLRAWLKEASRADWRSFADVRESFGSADQVGPYVVFNVGGNKFRLVAKILYRQHKVLLRSVLTHKQYDRGDWKAE